MDKQEAIDFFGGVNLTAEAIGVSGAAVDKWPDELTKGLQAKVIAAALQSHSFAKVKRAFPTFFNWAS